MAVEVNHGMFRENLASFINKDFSEARLIH